MKNEAGSAVHLLSKDLNWAMVELHCRCCKRSVDFCRTAFPDVPGWVARIEHDKCNICDNGDFSAEHWIAADGSTPDPDAMP